MTTIRINGQEVAAEDGEYLVDVATRHGAPVPALCRLPGAELHTSCMVCLVRDCSTARMVPACALPVSEGVDVDTNGEAVLEARRAALELLLSEHVGDCEAPCRRACPAFMDIPEMIRLLGQGAFEEADRLVRRDISMPVVLGHVCPAPCERACRRGAIDEPVAICILKREAGRPGLSAHHPSSSAALPTGKTVAVVGGGPAGLTAAAFLSVEGHACRLFEAADRLGGALWRCVEDGTLPADVLETEAALLANRVQRVECGVRVGRDVSLDELLEEHDAVVLAVGDDAGALPGVRDLGGEGDAVPVDRMSLRAGDCAVFACGNAVRPGNRLAVRAVADGKTVAMSVHQWLSGAPVVGRARRFNSSAGRLTEDELAELMKDASPEGRRLPAADGASVSADDLSRETRRCMHCDCRARDDCRLRDLCDEYRPSSSRFIDAERPALTKRIDGQVVYEPAKCVKCGICVRIAEQEANGEGLAFIGRSFTMRVDMPFGDNLCDALGDSLERCVDACPTGALAWKDKPQE